MYENAINLYNNPSNKLWSSIHNFLDCQVISPLIHLFIIKPFVYNERAWSHLSYINRHDNEYFLSRVHIITTPKFSKACDGLLATPKWETHGDAPDGKISFCRFAIIFSRRHPLVVFQSFTRGCDGDSDRNETTPFRCAPCSLLTWRQRITMWASPTRVPSCTLKSSTLCWQDY